MLTSIKEGKINCEPDVYWSSSRANSAGTFYASVNFANEGDVVATSAWIELFVLPVRHVSEEEVLAFIKAQDKD
jgi:hypothetical protein